MSATHSPACRSSSLNGLPGYFDIPRGVALTTPVCGPNGDRDVIGGVNVAPGKPAGKICRECPRLLWNPVDDMERRRAKRQERMSDCHAPAACAEQDNAVERRSDKAPPEALGETVAVRVVPRDPVLREHKRVDGADRSRVGGELVEAAHRGFLEWMGDVDAIQPKGPRRNDRCFEIRVRKSEPVEVDQPVQIAEPEPCALRLVHSRGP